MKKTILLAQINLPKKYVKHMISVSTSVSFEASRRKGVPKEEEEEGEEKGLGGEKRQSKKRSSSDEMRDGYSNANIPKIGGLSTSDSAHLLLHSDSLPRKRRKADDDGSSMGTSTTGGLTLAILDGADREEMELEASGCAPLRRAGSLTGLGDQSGRTLKGEVSRAVEEVSRSNLFVDRKSVV